MIRFPSFASLVAVLVVGTTAAADATAQTGVVVGVARFEVGGAPVPFALVRLVPADSTAVRSRTPPQGITDAGGRYRITDVRPGRYRVLLQHVGFQPVLSDPVDVAAGQMVQFPIRVALQPVVLPAVIVTAESCVTAGRLGDNPQIQTLWQQARAGAAVREGVMARFRYRIDLREEGVELLPSGPAARDPLTRPIFSNPQSASRNASRIREARLSQGYYAANDGWSLPNELDVLHDDFLIAHCLHSGVAYGIGEVGLRFRPLNARRDFLDVRGTIWLDSTTYFARRIELEYVDGEESRGTVRLDFSDVSVAGGALRMPVGGEYAMRPSRTNPAKRTQGKFTFTYSGFEEVAR